jgi:DNA polymerase-3 subunit alpha
MPHADFVHLRTHSAYSLSEGALKIPDLIALCARERMPAVAVCDTGNLFGALEFASVAAKAGVQPIIGCQIALRREGEARNGGAALPPDPIVLLVQNEIGYLNLLKLVSKSFMETDGGEAPQVDRADLQTFGAGLIALTGGPAGPVGKLLAEGQDPAAEALLVQLADIFAGRLYVELLRHGLDGERRIEPALIDLAYKYDLPLVATNEAFFADRAMFEAHDALTCIAEGAYVAQADRKHLTEEHYFKSAAEMRALFADLPEAVDNTLVVARRCAYMPESREPILPPYASPDGSSEQDAIRKQAAAGLEQRLAAHVWTPDMDEAAREVAAKPYRERLDFELGVIVKMGFAGYFLIVADFIQWAKEQDIPVGPGRGSGAGSVAAWALTITDLDPLRWGLLFERFLNPDRVSMPDFDIDFCMERRDEVIRYVQDKYGIDRVAQIITFGKLQARAVLRDVGRVLEMPYGQVDRICKLVPNNPASPVTLREAIDGEPQLQRMRDEDETVARLIGIALKLEGLYRHASTHAAGVVIGDRPLDELVPLYRDPRSDMAITQFSMKYVEAAGLVKFDFLGLKTLTVLARACDLIRDSGQDPPDLIRLPLDDAKAYEMMSRGETAGIFQFESSGMRNLLREAGVANFEDITALVALFRPGPMENIPKYTACKHGREKPEFLHETIEPVVADTYGVIIYQEQVMQIAQVFAGFTLGQADLLRRAMGKKIKSEMEAQRAGFVQGAVARGVKESRAHYVFDLVDKFAGYGFNKAHSAGYAMIAYQTAWLKANYPVEFMAALMTVESGNTDKIATLRGELERLDIALLPPDINKSGASFTVEETNGSRVIRYALAAVRNVGAVAMQAMVDERAANGPYRDMTHFAERLESRQINKRQLENLAAAGAFDSMTANRRQAFEAVETVMRHASAAHAERESKQDNLFGGAGADVAIRLKLPDVEDWTQEERLRREFEALGFYLSAHPLQSYTALCQTLGVTQWSEIAAGTVAENRVKLAGIVIGRRLTTSSRGSRMAFVRMSDASGSYELTLFSEVLATARELLDDGKPLLVTVDVQRRDEGIRLTAQKVELLEEVAATASAGLRIFVADEAPLETLAAVIREHGAKGRGRISLVLAADEREVELELATGYTISPGIRGAIKAIPGIVDVQDL